MTEEQQQKVLEIARSWIGREYKPGIPAQCANFVRSVFAEAGIILGVANPPDDFDLIKGQPTGASYADSFAGDAVGRWTNVCNRQPADIIMYSNTYGDYPPGTITHVGIYAGDDRIIHRPTSSSPVRYDRYDYMTIAQIRRPYDNNCLLVTHNNDRTIILHNNNLRRSGRIKLFFKPDRCGLAAFGDAAASVFYTRLSLWGFIGNTPVSWYTSTDNRLIVCTNGKVSQPKYQQLVFDIDGDDMRCTVDGDDIMIGNLYLHCTYC